MSRLQYCLFIDTCQDALHRHETILKRLAYLFLTKRFSDKVYNRLFVVNSMVMIAFGMSRAMEDDEIFRSGLGIIQWEDHTCGHKGVVTAMDKKHWFTNFGDLPQR